MIPTQKRQRSPSAPFIGLGFAVARARQVYDRAGRAPLSRAQAADIWGLAPKTSLGHRTIAALRNYGLIEDDGATEQIRISDLVAAVFVSQEDAVWQRAFAAAALNPELIAEYAAKWGAGRPSDGVCIDDLQTNHGFTAPAAKSFLPVFDEAMWFAGGGATGVFAAVPQSVSQMPAPSSRIRIGDYVQTPSAQSPGPHRVVWLADGGRYVYVEKTFTRYPVQSVTKIEASPFHLPSSQSGEPRTTKGASATDPPVGFCSRTSSCLGRSITPRSSAMRPGANGCRSAMPQTSGWEPLILRGGGKSPRVCAISAWPSRPAAANRASSGSVTWAGASSQTTITRRAFPRSARRYRNQH